MAEENKMVRLFQITTKMGIHYQVGVTGVKQYKEILGRIKKNKSEFVEVIPTLEIRKNDILSFEYFEKHLVEENGNEGKN